MKRLVLLSFFAFVVLVSCKRRHAEIVDNPSVNNEDAVGIDSINNQLAPQKHTEVISDSLKK